MIVVLSYDFPPNDGGISRLVSELVSGLDRGGELVRVLTVRRDTSSGPVRPDVPISEVARSGWRRDVETLFYILRLPRRAQLVATVWNPEATMAWLAGRSDRLFVLAHGNEVMPYPSSIRYGFRRWLRRRVLASARLVICNSRYTERLVRAACPAARTVTIPLGVDSERFKPTLDARAARDTFGIPKDRRVVLSVSRINAYKGHDTILRALAAVPDAARSKLHYVVAGKGEHLASLRQLACRLGVERHVQWLGYVGEDMLPNLYASADLFALCTREDPGERGVEGFGLAFLEAQATGIPVLGTRAGGIPDAVEEGQGGWLVAQEDFQAICDLLHRLAEGDPEFIEQARRGRERALRCSWRAYVARVAEALGAGASCEAQG